MHLYLLLQKYSVYTNLQLANLQHIFSIFFSAEVELSDHCNPTTQKPDIFYLASVCHAHTFIRLHKTEEKMFVKRNSEESTTLIIAKVVPGKTLL